jgi:hypothetical protein
MGLLDDAIRDHIDLKRRHGADPGEVARIESEALGPARREPVAAAPYDAGAEPATEAPSERSGASLAEAEPPPSEPATPEPQAAPKDEPIIDVDQPTQALDVEQAPPEDGADASAEGDDHRREDVLEDTPEFLQETPEHDRLWFEQKPPKDFDF